MGTLTISMVIFYSYVNVYQRVHVTAMFIHMRVDVHTHRCIYRYIPVNLGWRISDKKYMIFLGWQKQHQYKYKSRSFSVLW